VFRSLHADSFRSLQIRITTGRLRMPGVQSLKSKLDPDSRQAFDVAPTSAGDPAAIIFTTGSTGPPKAVLYRHEMFDAQIRILRDHFKITPGEIDLPTFP